MISFYIYPISKFGLTTIQNIVLICKTYNSKESNNTLSIFRKKQNFDYLDMCERLGY